MTEQILAANLDYPEGERMKGFLACHFSLLALFLTLPNSGAATINRCDAASLHAALNAGGTIVFGCSGTITLTQTIVVAVSATLDGGSQQVTISGGNAVGLFRVEPGVSFGVRNLTLANGLSQTGGGAIYNNGGHVDAYNVRFATNSTRGTNDGFVRGGAIYNRAGGLMANASAFLGNIAVAAKSFDGGLEAQGGAIYSEQGWLNLTDCSFMGNTALGTAGTNFRFDGFWFIPEPGTAGSGGALFNAGTAVVDRCVFQENRVEGGRGRDGSDGGFLSFSKGGGSGAAGGRAAGGAIHNSSVLLMQSCNVTSNVVAGGRGGNGGAGGSGSGPCGNGGGAGGRGGAGGEALGGGLFNSGLCAPTATTLAGNRVSAGVGGTAGSGGGAAGAGGSGGSGGAASGGAIHNVSTNSQTGLLCVTNSTLIFNFVSGGDGQNGAGALPGSTCPGSVGGNGGWGGSGGDAQGGAIHFFSAAEGCLVNCTLFGNQVVAGTNGLAGPASCGRALGNACGVAGQPGVPGRASGGAVAMAGSATGAVSVVNSIFAGSIGGLNCFGSLIDSGHNICSDTSSPFTNFTSLTNIDAGLVLTPAQNLTIALLPSSRALDAGSDQAAPAVDQRGVPRPQGNRSDIGAFEAGHLSIQQQDTNLNIRYGAPPGTTYLLQSSEDLRAWRTVETKVATPNGTILFSPIPRVGRSEVFRTRTP